MLLINERTVNISGLYPLKKLLSKSEQPYFKKVGLFYFCTLPQKSKMIYLSYSINQSILKECPAINCQLFFSKKEGIVNWGVEIFTVEEGQEAFYAHALSELMKRYKIPEEEHLGNLLVIATVFWIELEGRTEQLLDFYETYPVLKFLKEYKEIEELFMKKPALHKVFNEQASFQMNIGSEKIVFNDSGFTHFMVKSLYRNFREQIHNNITWSLGDRNVIPSAQELDFVIKSTDPNRGALTVTIAYLLWYIQNHMKGLLVRKEYRFIFDLLNLLDLTKEAGIVNGKDSAIRYKRPRNYEVLNRSDVKHWSNDKTAFIKEKNAFIKALMESAKRKGDFGLSVGE